MTERNNENPSGDGEYYVVITDDYPILNTLKEAYQPGEEIIVTLLITNRQRI